MKTFKKFGITKDPFSGDVVKADDVYLTDDTRFAAEYLMQAARAGGMVALVGESGSGKTTIRRYAVDRMAAEERKVRVVAPPVRGQDAAYYRHYLRRHYQRLLHRIPPARP
ncbi:MAG: hypothetical protein LBJ90_04120 [Treponema sp.]|jgi:type II secretory pathway predicted ATPase ExeA|nr:hypothetical protein [Treponema sp.]